MAYKDAKNTFKGSTCVQDVPLLLRVVLRFSQVMGAAPLRLRRARAGWLLGVSRGTAVLQRILFVLSSACVSTALILDLLEEDADKRVLIGISDVASFLGCSEQLFLLLVYLFGVLSATDTIESVVALLKQTRKMSSNNEWFKNVKYQRGRASMLISFIIWKTSTNIAVALRIGATFNRNKMVNCLYLPCIYQHLITDTFQLQCSSTIVEINFAVTKINDQLEHLLIKPAIIYYLVKTKVYRNKLGNKTTIFDDIPLPGTRNNVKDASATIRQLAQHHVAICEIIWKMNKTHGLFFLLSFILLFLRSLITELFFFSFESNKSMIWELNWICMLLSNIMLIVEPCHWLQDQMKRTRCLLSQIASRSGGSNEQVSKELDLFILQVQTNKATFAPMGVFVLGRPLVASLLGGVVTYLVIVFQMLHSSDNL